MKKVRGREQKMPNNDSKDSYPYVLLVIDGGTYAINSRYIVSIMKLPKYNWIPGAPKGVLGVIDFRGDAIPVIDMRTIFDMPSLAQEYDDFVKMLDERKADHVFWVDELERSLETGEEFTLATDPHKCKFGHWYDNFETDSQMVRFHMKKIEEPHRKLHETVLQLGDCDLAHDNCERSECRKEVLRKAKEVYMPQVLGLLEDAKSIFQTSYTEMAIVMEKEGHKIAIVVDEIQSVEKLISSKNVMNSLSFHHSEYICDVKQKAGNKKEDLILELNDELLLEDAKHISVEE